MSTNVRTASRTICSSSDHSNIAQLLIRRIVIVCGNQPLPPKRRTPDTLYRGGGVDPCAHLTDVSSAVIAVIGIAAAFAGELLRTAIREVVVELGGHRPTAARAASAPRARGRAREQVAAAGRRTSRSPSDPAVTAR